MPSWELMQGLKQSYDSGEFTDFTLICDGTSYKVHKVVLGSQSTFFQKAFTVDMKEKRESQMTLPKDEADVLPSLLQFLYTGDYDHHKDGTAMHHAQLFATAEKYGIAGLRLHVKKNLRIYLHAFCVEFDANVDDIADVLGAISFVVEHSPVVEPLYNMMVQIPWKPVMITSFKPLWIDLAKRTPQYGPDMATYNVGLLEHYEVPDPSRPLIYEYACPGCNYVKRLNTLEAKQWRCERCDAYSAWLRKEGATTTRAEEYLEGE